MQEMRLLAGRIVVVTGAARGIGRAIAELFLAHGAKVVGGDILPIELDAADGDGRFVGIRCDVAEDGDVRRLIETAVEHHGRIDCLVNDAAAPGPIEGIAEIPPDQFERTVSLVLGSVFRGIRHVAPVMRRQRAGSIVNIGSTSSLRASSVLQPYGAAKAGVNMLTQSAAMELGPDGIRVNCLCPGGIATALYDITAGLDRDEAERRVGVVAGNLAGAQPLGRAGTVREVAGAALWLASDLSSYVTGQIIAVDGGMTIGRPMPPGITPDAFFGKIAGVA